MSVKVNKQEELAAIVERAVARMPQLSRAETHTKIERAFSRTKR